MMRTIPCLARVHSKMFRSRPIKKYTVIYNKEKPTTITFSDTFSNRLVANIAKIYVVSYGLITFGVISASFFIIGSIAFDNLFPTKRRY